MIFLSAFSLKPKSGGEYISSIILKDYYGSKVNTSIFLDEEKSIYKKVFFYILFFLFPLLNPQITRRFSLKNLKLLKKESEIIFNFTQTFIYTLFLPKTNKTLIVHDLLYQVETRRKRYFLVPIVYFWEYIFFRIVPNTNIKVLNSKDKNLLIKIYKVSSDKITVIDIQNHIKLDYVRLITDDKFSYKYGIIGAWARHENRDGLIEFIKYYNKYKLRTKILICGSNTDFISNILAINENFVNIGFVEEISDFFKMTDKIIIPLRLGAGVKIKVLQALSCNIKCLGTPVAFEGIDDNQNMERFENIEEIVKYIANE